MRMRFRAVITSDSSIAAIVGVCLLVIYALSAPRVVTLEDDALFIMAAFEAGVAHPPGYPLFTFIGWLFSLLPTDSPAWQMHILSGLLGAMACSVLYLVARQIRMPIWAAVLAALCWGISEHFWSQAIITEVYTLNSLLCIATLYFCFQAREGVRPGHEPKAASLNLAALCFGLGIANHLPLIVLAFPGLVILLLPYWRRLIRHIPRLLGIALGVASLFYLWMIWRSYQDNIAFYGPIDLNSLWFYLSRSGYSSVDFSSTARVADTLAFIGLFARELALQLSIAGGLLALIGVYSARKNGLGRIAIATICTLLAHSVFVILIREVDYDDLNIAVFRPYPITAYGLWALWMGYGAVQVCEYFKTRIKPAWPLPAAAFLIPLYLYASNLEVNDRSEDTFARDYAMNILNNLPENSVFLTTGDSDTGPLGYMRRIKKVRTDIELINTQGLVFPNRLFDPVHTKSRQKKKLLAEYISSREQPQFSLGTTVLPGNFGTVHHALFHELRPNSVAGSQTLKADDGIIDYLVSLEPYSRSTDKWILHTLDKIMYRAGRWLGYAIISGDPKLQPHADKIRQLLQNQYHGLVGIAEVLVPYGKTPEHRKEAAEIIARAEPLMEKRLLQKEREGWHYYVKGFLALKNERKDEALEHFRHSVKIYPHKNNSSVKILEQITGKKVSL